MSLAVLHRDDHVVAIDKPPGLLVHRTDLDRGATRFAVQMLRDQLGVRVWPAHRLDKGTSGVLVFGLSAAAAAALGRAFDDAAVAKRYVALVRGWPAPGMVLDHPLARIRDDYATPSAAAPAQAATTLLRRLAALELPQPDDRHPTSRYALVDLEPRTGRRHQLRRHLKHAAHPIIGDATYGKGRHNRFIAAQIGVARLWLHARSIAFAHPATGAALTIAAPLGAEWQRLLALQAWQWDADDALTPPAEVPAALRAAAPGPLR